MSARPEPLRFYQAFRAAFLVLMAGQVFTSLLPTTVTGVLLLVAAAVDKGVTEFYTRPAVTPVAAPQAHDGTPLVPLVIPEPHRVPDFPTGPPAKKAAAKTAPARKAAKKA